MPIVLICFWSIYTLSPDTQRAAFPVPEPSPLLCFEFCHSVFLIFSATSDCGLSINCVLETQLCLCHPLCGDEAQTYASIGDLFLSSRCYTMPSLVLRIATINLLCEGMLSPAVGL